MYISEISNIATYKIGPNFEALQKSWNFHEVKTTVDLTRLHLRTYDQNIITKIEWASAENGYQGFITLADGAKLLLQEGHTNALGVSKMQVGDYVEISQYYGGVYCANGIAIAHNILDKCLLYPKDHFTPDDVPTILPVPGPRAGE